MKIKFIKRHVYIVFETEYDADKFADKWLTFFKVRFYRGFASCGSLYNSIKLI